jgi:hypothetical protein
MLIRVMRGWRRKVVVAVGVIAGLLLAAAWGNSYRQHVWVGWGGGQRFVNVGATRGSLALQHARIETSGNGNVRFSTSGWYHGTSGSTPITPALFPRDCDIYWSLGPFNFQRGGESAPATPSGMAWRISWHELIVPFWFVALVLVAVLAMLFRLRRPRPAPGLCATCGYDLRASPQRCPECGAVA